VSRLLGLRYVGVIWITLFVGCGDEPPLEKSGESPPSNLESQDVVSQQAKKEIHETITAYHQLDSDSQALFTHLETIEATDEIELEIPNFEYSLNESSYSSQRLTINEFKPLASDAQNSTDGNLALSGISLKVILENPSLCGQFLLNLLSILICPGTVSITMSINDDQNKEYTLSINGGAGQSISPVQYQQLLTYVDSIESSTIDSSDIKSMESTLGKGSALADPTEHLTLKDYSDFETYARKIVSSPNPYVEPTPGVTPSNDDPVISPDFEITNLNSIVYSGKSTQTWGASNYSQSTVSFFHKKYMDSTYAILNGSTLLSKKEAEDVVSIYNANTFNDLMGLGVGLGSDFSCFSDFNPSDSDTMNFHGVMGNYIFEGSRNTRSNILSTHKDDLSVYGASFSLPNYNFSIVGMSDRYAVMNKRNWSTGESEVYRIPRNGDLSFSMPIQITLSGIQSPDLYKKVSDLSQPPSSTNYYFGSSSLNYDLEYVTKISPLSTTASVIPVNKDTECPVDPSEVTDWVLKAAYTYTDGTDTIPPKLLVGKVGRKTGESTSFGCGVIYSFQEDSIGQNGSYEVDSSRVVNLSADLTDPGIGTIGVGLFYKNDLSPGLNFGYQSPTGNGDEKAIKSAEYYLYMGQAISF
jgi:thiamine pyrophosphokinase